jgi:hypothetical protein
MESNMLVYFTALWYNLCPLDINYGRLVYFSRLDHEKSGNPDMYIHTSEYHQIKPFGLQLLPPVFEKIVQTVSD